MTAPPESQIEMLEVELAETRRRLRQKHAALSDGRCVNPVELDASTEALEQRIETLVGQIDEWISTLDEEDAA